MLLRSSLGLAEEAATVEAAVARVLADGARTADIAGPGDEWMGTVAMGDLVIAALR